jgi:hypothetical protein
MSFMQERTTISAREFCQHHQIELSFIYSLREYGLIEVEVSGDEDCFLPQEELDSLEKLVRLHYDLQINMEGLDAIHHLLQRVETLQQEVIALRNKLRLHSNE